MKENAFYALHFINAFKGKMTHLFWILLVCACSLDLPETTILFLRIAVSYVSYTNAVSSGSGIFNKECILHAD
jgi:hypothetical protein